MDKEAQRLESFLVKKYKLEVMDMSIKNIVGKKKNVVSWSEMT